MFSRLFHSFGKLLLILFITFILLEILLFFGTRQGWLLMEIPSYSFNNIHSYFWVEIDKNFGPWHNPNSSYFHKRTCFEATYKANSFGMRDVERSLQSPQGRTIVLGDSMVEGFGVADEERMTHKLEKLRGREHLNFGTSGYFGPTQFYLLYSTLAKKFDHDEILIALYPKNDFNDDNPEVWKGTDRYRPLWVGDYPHYQLSYTTPAPRGAPIGPSNVVKGFLREFTYTYNLYDYVKGMIKFKLQSPEFKSAQKADYSPFYDFSEAEWLRLRYNLEKIRQEAPDKKIVVALLPAPNFLDRYQKEGNSPLAIKLGELGKELNFQLIDLLPRFAKEKDRMSLFNFPCDRHFSASGNSLAAQIIAEEMKH